jgi:hypothetical protein
MAELRLVRFAEFLDRTRLARSSDALPAQGGRCVSGYQPSSFFVEANRGVGGFPHIRLAHEETETRRCSALFSRQASRGVLVGAERSSLDVMPLSSRPLPHALPPARSSSSKLMIPASHMGVMPTRAL